MKSIVLLVSFAVGAAFLPVAQSQSDELQKSATPAVAPLRGKTVGEVRDDNGLKMKLVWCPPGKFTMGTPEWEHDRHSDEDQVDVTLTKGFWLGKYEVTQAEWKQLMETEPWKAHEYAKEGAACPATFVDWDDAMQFCRKLTEQERRGGRLPGDWECSLPTEAQWEYSCRAGSEGAFSFGDDESKLGEYAWFFDNAWNTGERFAHDVGKKKPNQWGIHDMHGNAWEWCRDFYKKELPGGIDPEVNSLKSKAPSRVIRGGSWNWVSTICRSGNRSQPLPGNGNRFDSYGFRVALGAVAAGK